MDNCIKVYAEKLKNLSHNLSVQEKDGFKDIEELIKTLYLNCDEKSARILTIYLIILTNNVQSNTENVKADIHKELYDRILSSYKFYVTQKCQNLKLLKRVLFADVTDSLWTDCFDIISKLEITHENYVYIDNLLHIKRPENLKREAVIANFVKELIASNDKNLFIQGIEWIEKFNLEKLLKDQFENIIYKAHLNGIPESLEKILTTKKLKGNYVKALDECLEDKNNPKFGINEFKLQFIELNDSTILETLIYNEANTYGIDIDRPGYSIYSKKIIEHLRDKFHNSDRCEFERFAVSIIHNHKGFEKCNFINIFMDDPKYAYCWTQYLKLEEWETPYFVKICGDCYHDDADAFIKSMNRRLELPLDFVEICTILGKEYKLIMITTPRGLNNFLQEYFIDSNPKILGIDCETYKFRISLLQIATPEWVCIIDVKVLLKMLSDIEWKNFFHHLFNPDVPRIGYDVQTDFSFFCNTFPLFSEWIKKDVKLICLSKLSKAILEDPAAKNVVFSKLNQGIVVRKSNLSLADIATAVLNIELNKSLQKCNWKWRPLTQEQKIYVVTDAIVVIMIKEKVESDLKSAFDEETAAIVINEGYIYHKMKKKLIQ